jgi:hypothetical protein
MPYALKALALFFQERAYSLQEGFHLLQKVSHLE